MDLLVEAGQPRQTGDWEPWGGCSGGGGGGWPFASPTVRAVHGRGGP